MIHEVYIGMGALADMEHNGVDGILRDGIAALQQWAVGAWGGATARIDGGHEPNLLMSYANGIWASPTGQVVSESTLVFKIHSSTERDYLINPFCDYARGLFQQEVVRHISWEAGVTDHLAPVHSNQTQFSIKGE